MSEAGGGSVANGGIGTSVVSVSMSQLAASDTGSRCGSVAAPRSEPRYAASAVSAGNNAGVAGGSVVGADDAAAGNASFAASAASGNASFAGGERAASAAGGGGGAEDDATPLGPSVSQAAFADTGSLVDRVSSAVEQEILSGGADAVDVAVAAAAATSEDAGAASAYGQVDEEAAASAAADGEEEACAHFDTSVDDYRPHLAETQPGNFHSDPARAASGSSEVGGAAAAAEAATTAAESEGFRGTYGGNPDTPVLAEAAHGFLDAAGASPYADDGAGGEEEEAGEDGGAVAVVVDGDGDGDMLLLQHEESSIPTPTKDACPFGSQPEEVALAGVGEPEALLVQGGGAAADAAAAGTDDVDAPSVEELLLRQQVDELTEQLQQSHVAAAAASGGAPLPVVGPGGRGGGGGAAARLRRELTERSRTIASLEEAVQADRARQAAADARIAQLESALMQQQQSPGVLPAPLQTPQSPTQRRTLTPSEHQQLQSSRSVLAAAQSNPNSANSADLVNLAVTLQNQLDVAREAIVASTGDAFEEAVHVCVQQHLDGDSPRRHEIRTSASPQSAHSPFRHYPSRATTAAFRPSSATGGFTVTRAEQTAIDALKSAGFSEEELFSPALPRRAASPPSAARRGGGGGGGGGAARYKASSAAATRAATSALFASSATLVAPSPWRPQGGGAGGLLGAGSPYGEHGLGAGYVLPCTGLSFDRAPYQMSRRLF